MFGGDVMKEKLMRYKTELTVFFVFTAVFVVAARLAVYILPFVIALTVAVVMKPVYDFLRRRYLFRSAFTATAISLLIFGAFLAMAGFLLYLIAAQAISLFENYRSVFEEYFKAPEIFDTVRDSLLKGDLLDTAADLASTLIRAVPLTLTFVIITFALTVFFLNRLTDIRDMIVERSPENRRELIKKALSTAYMLTRRFIRSYLLLYLITFVEAVFIFYLTGIQYPLAFAFITAAADILPVLGPGSVYIPFAVIFILQGNYISGATLAAYFLFTVILRQILEPKIVSDTVKIHPLAVLSAIYFSIAAMNIWVLFYVTALFMLFKVIRMVGSR